MEQQPRMPPAEKELLRSKMRNRYAVHIDDLAETGSDDTAGEGETESAPNQSAHIDTDASDTW